MAEPPPDLRFHFLAAKSRESELQNLDTSGDQYLESLEWAISDLEKCRRLIQQISIFSPNENHDEIATSDIQYFGVDYLLAQMILRKYDSDRWKILQEAGKLFESFLVRLEAYELLSKPNQQLLEQYQEDPNGFQLASAEDATNRRNVKVRRYQEGKELKARLELLRTESKQGSADEETIRRLYFTELELFAGQSFEAMDMIAREIKILSRIQDAPQNVSALASDPREGHRGDLNGYSERLDGPTYSQGLGGALLTKDGKPLQPFTITDKRSQFRDGVFRPGHNLPTMSIDDYLEEERRRGGIADGTTEPQQLAQQPDEDDMELADQETMKARAWDEYVEANPKGSGNTMNRG